MARGRDALIASELLAAGADAWDSGRFFDAHEEWEAAWMPIRGTDEGDRRKGAIAMAGAFVHLAASRPEPARRLLQRALELLRPTSDPVRDAALGELRRRAESALSDLSRGDVPAAGGRAGRFPRAALTEAGTNAASVG